jgi:hypothetical protein
MKYINHAIVNQFSHSSTFGSYLGKSSEVFFLKRLGGYFESFCLVGRVGDTDTG